MATTTTTNLGLVKPDYSEAADIQVLNGNADKIDGACGKYQNALAIVANGNTHGAITSGQYVYVRGHSTLAEGLYTAKSAIAVNATLSGANLTAVSGGGLNKVDAALTDMNTGVDAGTYTYALPGNGFYCALIRKINASGDGTQGLYLISANASMSRLQVTPVLALGGSMSLTGAYVDGVPTLTLNTSNQTYVNCTIVDISA